jgi:5'-methylthioadenosine phosphorylase
MSWPGCSRAPGTEGRSTLPRIDGAKREGRVGIIGGTGPFESLQLTGEHITCETYWGSQSVSRVALGGREALVVLRHGEGHTIPPQRVNYRAQIAALAQLGVENVLALNACGGMSIHATPGTAVIVDQFLDFTHGRVSTFCDEEGDPVVHVDVSTPYCPRLRRQLRDACAATGLAFASSGTYVAAEGPRFESAAEVRMFQMLGGDVVGMTGIPELVLAREAGLCYASLCMVANHAAGVASQGPIRHSEVEASMARLAEPLRLMLTELLPRIEDDAHCTCRTPH